MRNNYSSQQSCIEEFSQIINFNFASDSALLEACPLLHIEASNLSRGSRIRSRRVSSFYSASLLMKSSKFTGMNSAVLRSRGSSSSPAFDDSKWALYVENKFGIDITYLVPINGCGSEGISNSQAKIGKDQSRSLNSKVDRDSNQEDESAEGEIFSSAVLGFQKRGGQHPKAEEISQTAIDSRALSTKDNRIASGVNQSAEFGVSHE